MGRLLTVGAAAVMGRAPSPTSRRHSSSACSLEGFCLDVYSFLAVHNSKRLVSSMSHSSLRNNQSEVFSRAAVLKLHYASFDHVVLSIALLKYFLYCPTRTGSPSGAG